VSTSLIVGSLVGGGPLATVHRASSHGRVVAVKRARAGVPGAAAALRREARVLTAASHPAIVAVLDLLDDPVEPALVLGWADGGSLGDLLADGPLPADDLLHLLRPLAGGLEALHGAGVAHLDVTAGNVLLAAAGPILVDPAPPGAGTPGFTDPAVVAGGPASPRSDVYGLAACAHLALTGRLPRPVGGTALGLVLPEAVLAALAMGLHPEPRRRPASPSAFVERLAEALGSPPAPPPQAVTRSPGRPVPRAAPPSTGPARTWPFDRWHEEAAATADRHATVARLIDAAAPGRRRRRRRTVALGLLVGCGAAIGLVTATVPALHADGSPRTSAPDSTRRPPATRPQPPTTPGGNP
jgi:serine/threonine protein kinase